VYQGLLHGTEMKIINAQQARVYNIYKNTKLKLTENECSNMVQQDV